jgi:hypothetical protein
LAPGFGSKKEAKPVLMTKIGADGRAIMKPEKFNVAEDPTFPFY